MVSEVNVMVGHGFEFQLHLIISNEIFSIMYEKDINIEVQHMTSQYIYDAKYVLEMIEINEI